LVSGSSRAGQATRWRNRFTGDVQSFSNRSEQVFPPSVKTGVAGRRARIVVVTGGNLHGNPTGRRRSSCPKR
jgi:hypothetical protein